MLSTCSVGCQAFPGIGRWRPVVIPARGMLVSIPMIQINTPPPPNVHQNGKQECRHLLVPRVATGCLLQYCIT